MTSKNQRKLTLRNAARMVSISHTRTLNRPHFRRDVRNSKKIVRGMGLRACQSLQNVSDTLTEGAAMIRPTLPSDTPALVAMTEKTGVFKPLEVVALQLVLDEYHAGTAGPQHYAITFDQDGRPAGFAYFALKEMTDRTWQLWWIVVDPEVHARGIGSQLLRYVEDTIRTANGRLLLIETSQLPHYELTRRFYLKHGYEKEATVRDFYADGDDQVIFRKRF